MMLTGVHPAAIKTKREDLGPTFRKWTKFIVLLSRCWLDHASRVKAYVDLSVDTKSLEAEENELLFDKNLFKSGQESRVLPKMREILLKDPRRRTVDELNYVTIALGSYSAFSSFPSALKRLIARVGRYETHRSRRLILKEGHVARCVYYILSGEVIVSKMNDETGQSETRCFLSRNDIFGELAIINNARRNASIVTRRPIELLVFADQDYTEVFMLGGLRHAQEAFLRKLPCLDGWPVDILADNRTMASIKYFRKNVVLIHNSKYSDWLVIVKSGTCSVLKKLRQTIPTQQQRQQSSSSVSPAQTRDAAAETVTCSAVAPDIDSCQPINDLTAVGDGDTGTDGTVGQKDEDDDAQTSAKVEKSEQSADSPVESVRKQRRLLYVRRELENLQFGTKLQKVIRQALPRPPPIKSSQVSLAEFETRQPTIVDDFMVPAFINTSSDSTAVDINVTDTKQTSINGQEMISWPDKLLFTDMLNTRYFSKPRPVTDADRHPQFIEVQVLQANDVFGLSDLLHEDQPGLSLVSNGAQCVLIHKRLYKDHASRPLMARLTNQVRAYPNDDQLQQGLQLYVDWLATRAETLKQTIDASGCRRIKPRTSRRRHASSPLAGVVVDVTQLRATTSTVTSS
jgi:CRP-like cAMP-binding protein